MQRPTRHASLIVVMFLAAALPGCQRQKGPDLSGEVARLNGDLAAEREKAAKLEKELAAAKDATTLATTAGTDEKKQLDESAQRIRARDEQIAKLMAENSALKKSDAFVFAEIAAVQQKGLNGTALQRYQQFIQDYPKSALVARANSAIAELTPTAQQEAKLRAATTDPNRGERELLRRFADGLVTVDEIVPLVKNKTAAEVVKLLGQPNTSFHNGTELGYADKVIDTASGSKETLVIKFDEKGVSTLRVGYRGREIRP